MVINSTYETLDSAAPFTKKSTTSDDPVQLVRQQYLNVLHTEPELPALHDWADQMLRCEDSAPCLVDARAALAKYLEGARETRTRRHLD
jgi:hypothetical protein